MNKKILLLAIVLITIFSSCSSEDSSLSIYIKTGDYGLKAIVFDPTKQKKDDQIDLSKGSIQMVNAEYSSSGLDYTFYQVSDRDTIILNSSSDLNCKDCINSTFYVNHGLMNSNKTVDVIVFHVGKFQDGEKPTMSDSTYMRFEEDLMEFVEFNF